MASNRMDKTRFDLPTVSIRLYEIRCAEHRTEILDLAAAEMDADNDLFLTVEPCQKCLDEAEKTGYENCQADQG